MIPFLCYYTDLRVNNSCVGSCFMVTAQNVSERIQQQVCVCVCVHVCVRVHAFDSQGLYCS